MLTFFHLNNDQACKFIKLQIREYKKIIKYYSVVKIKAYLITLISYDKNRTHFSINQKIHRLELVFLLFQFANHQTSFHIPFRLFLKRQHVVILTISSLCTFSAFFGKEMSYESVDLLFVNSDKAIWGVWLHTHVLVHASINETLRWIELLIRPKTNTNMYKA